jgi:hypothetical protein
MIAVDYCQSGKMFITYKTTSTENDFSVPLNQRIFICTISICFYKLLEKIFKNIFNV